MAQEKSNGKWGKIERRKDDVKHNRIATQKLKIVLLKTRMYFLLFPALLLVLVFLLRFFLKDFNYWKKRKIPHFINYPVVGSAWPIVARQQSIGEFFASKYEATDEKYIGFHLLQEPALIIRDPDIIKNVLIKDFDYFADRTFYLNKDDRFAQFLLLIMSAEKWKPFRALVTPLFSTGKNKSMIPLMNDACDRLVTYINNVSINEEESNCRNLSIRYAIEVVAYCYFSFDSHSFETENPIFLKMCKKFFDVQFLRSVQVASHFMSPFLVRMFKMKFLEPTSANFMRDVCFQALDERKKSQSHRGDLIDILLKSYEENPKSAIEEDKLAAMFIQFIVAGYETIGGALAYVMFELSLHLDVQEKLRQEIQESLKKHKTITYEVIQDMKYLEMVLKESERKYPILPFLDRRCLKTYKVPEHDLTIEKGTGVFVSLLGLHRDPKYFENPNKFDPERFKKNLDIPSCAFLPFGGGLRKCIGSRFADLSIKVALIRLLSNFHIEKSKNTSDEIMFSRDWVFLVPENVLGICIKPLRKDT